MASKDDDFDFKWDDDGSFDSELDKFGGDVDEYRPDEVKDAEKDRNPVTSKLKSIAPTIRDAGSAVLAGAGVQIGKSIEKNVPEVYQTYNNATYVLSEAETLRNQVVDKVKPWWNDTKRVLRKLSQQLDGQMPFGLDKKILKLIGEEEQDQQYKQPSKEDMRREQMDSNINHIFELQMQKSMEQQKDTILNRTIDRRIANIHHKESASFLAKIAENSVFQHAFTSSVFTAYLKKDLELKYKHFYVSEDILEVFKNHAKAVDTKLDAVIKNTALPEADKIHMSERVIGGMKAKLADTFNDKLQNYFGKVREKVLRHVNDALDMGKMFTDIIGSQVDMLEIMNDPEMAAMGGMGSEPSIFSKKGLMHLLLGNVGGFFAKRALKPLWDKVPQETQELLRQYFRKGRNGIALLMDDLKSGRIKGVPEGLRDILQSIAPRLNENLDKGFVLNEGFQTLDQGAKFTTKFVKTVEDIIPGYLAMQTRYLEMMATNKDSGIQRWNFKTMSFENEKDRMERVREMVNVSDSTGKDRLQKSVIETRKMIEHKSDRYGVAGSLIAKRVKESLQKYYPEIELFIVNLAYSDRYYQVKPKEFIEELDAIVKAENLQDLAKIPLYNEGFQDIENVKQVAGFWLDVLSDRSKDGKAEAMPDKAAIVSFNNRLLDERAEVTRSYTAMLEDELKKGNFEAIKAFGGKIGPDGRVVLDLRTLRRNEFKTTSHINIEQDLSAEQIKNYNDTFKFNELEKENDKNVLLEKFKNFLSNLKKIDPREMTDDLGKPIFSWFYRKLKGENKEKELEEAWKKVLHGVDVTKDFMTNTYNKAASAIEGWYNKLQISTVYELLSMVADADSKNSTAWHLLRNMVVVRDVDGKKELRSLADLDASEWYDWFSHLSDPASAAAQFNNGDAKSNLLLSLFPDDIKALIFAICNDPELTKKMKLVNQQLSSSDPEIVKRRQAELKRLAEAAIEDTKRKIADRSTAYSTMNNAKYDALTADVARIAKNNKELREREMSQISTEGFNGTEEHNYIKQQLDVLKSIDTQLSEFYYAFVDSKRKEAERKRIRKTYDKVSDGLTGKKYEQDDEIDKATTADEKMVVAYDKLNELYDRYGAAKRKGDKTGVDKANKAIRDILRKFYGDEVQLSNLETYVNKFSDENTDKYRELKRIRSATFNPYTGQVEELTDEEAKKYSNVAERDAALIDEIIKKKDSTRGNRLKIRDAEKAALKEKEQSVLYCSRARKQYLKLLKGFAGDEKKDRNFIKSIPNSDRSPQIGETAIGIRDIILKHADDLLDDVDYYVPISEIYSYLVMGCINLYDKSQPVKRYWYQAMKKMLTSRLDDTLRNRTITSLEYMGIFIQPIDDVDSLLEQANKDAHEGIRTKDTSAYERTAQQYAHKDKSEHRIRQSFDIDFNDLLKLASAKSLDDYADINKQLSTKYKREININKDILLDALSEISNRRSKIGRYRSKLSGYLDRFGENYANDAEARDTVDIIDAIRDNFSTYEDISDNGVDTLNNMLKSLLRRYGDHLDKNTTIEDLFEMITGKNYDDTVSGKRVSPRTNDLAAIIENLRTLRNPQDVLALPAPNHSRRDPVMSRMIHNEDMHFNDLIARNKIKIESATSNPQSEILALPYIPHEKYAKGGNFDINDGLSYSAFRRRVRKSRELSKLSKGPLTPDVVQKITAMTNQFMYGKSKNYRAFRPYFMKMQGYSGAEALCEFLHRHPEYRDGYLEQLVDNECYCVRDTDPSIATSPLTTSDMMMLQIIDNSTQTGPCAIKGRPGSGSIILYPKHFPLIEHLLYHELGHIKDPNADATNIKNMREYSKYSDGVMSGHYGKGSRVEHHADWFGIRKAYEKHGAANVHDTLKLYMQDTLGNKHIGDIYIRDAHGASPRIAIIGAGINIGAYAYKIIHSDGKVEWVPLTDTYHISRPVYQIKDIGTGEELDSPIEVISIKDIRNTQRSMQTGDNVGLVNYDPTTNTYELAVAKSDMKYRTNLMYRALRRYGMDPNKGYAPDQQVKMMYANGGNFDAEAEVQNYQNKYDKIARTAYGRDKDKAVNSLVETTLTGIEKYANIRDMYDEAKWLNDSNALESGADDAKWCIWLEWLLQKAPMLDKTDYYRQWLNIPDTVHVAAIHMKESTIRKYYPELDADFWKILTAAKNRFNNMCAVKDPRYKNSGYIIRRLTEADKKYKAIELFGILHELGHIVTERGTVYGVGNEAHKGRGHYTEKHADIYGLKKYIADLGPTGLSRVTDWLAWTASSAPNDDDFNKAKSNGSDGRWRADLMRRYMRMRKYKGDPLYANLNDEFLKPQFRNNYAKGDNISFSLPIDRIGGYVDQPTEILGGSGIAGEAGGETIIPHKYNERFKELIYRCLRDTVGENMARKVLRMMKPSDTTKEKLGINLPDTGYGMLFAKGGDLSGKLSRDEIKKRIESIDATLADHEENSNYRLDYIEQIRKEKADLENQLKVEDMSKQKEEYTRQHPTDTIKGILLNIMESNEAIYRKIGDGLLVVDLAAMLDKLKDTKILDKLKSLKIGEKIKNFVFGAYDKGKGFAGRAYDFGKNVTKTVASNIGSFGRHMFTNKVCDVYLKSKIEGQVHGDLKIKSSELEHGTIFADPECTKPIYSVADIYPPVYRKVDKNGTETVEEAIREDEGKDGLVDVEGHSLVRFGGKVGRFLRHVATTPLKAILTHKNWERLKGLGTSIASGIGSGINGLLDAYCDVYTTKNLEKPLVYGESIKEGRLVRVLEGGKTKVVPTVFDIDGPCWLLIDDPDKPGERKLGNEVIKEEHITDGLCHKDGSPIESTKIAKAASMLRRAAGAIGNGLLSLTGGIFNAGSTVISWAWDKGKTAAKWVKDRVKDAFTAKNPYIDVCVIRDNEKKVVMHADELRTNKATHRYCFMDKDGKMTPVLSAYGIDAPVFDMRGSKIKDTDAYDHKPIEIITKDDIDHQAIYDTEGNRLTKWAGRSLAGKIGAAALGSVKFGWKAIKGLGKGLWNVGKTVLGGIGSLLGEGGAAVTSFFTKAWSSTLDFFKNSVISRKDLKELVGDRLLDIYGLLYKYMPRKEYNPNDKDGDGDVDGSWADYEQRRKAREEKRKQEEAVADAGKSGDIKHDSFLTMLKNAFLSGFGGEGGSSTGFADYILGALGLKTLFPGKGAGAAAGAGKAGLLKRLFSPIANLFGKKKNGSTVAPGKLYNLKKKIAEFFVGNMDGSKRGILNILGGYGLKAKNAVKGKTAGAWSGIKDFFGRLSAERKIAALRSRIAAQHAQIMGRSAAGAATGAAGKGFLSKLFGGKLLSSLGTKFGARIAAAGAANAAPPVIGQIVSAGLLLWTAYDIVKHFATDSTKVKGLRPIRLKAYGVDVKYWEAIEDLETDTFSEFKSGNSEGVDVDRLKKFGYKIDFLDAGEMAYGGDKLEYIRTWYKLKFIPFYQKYVQSLILACKLDPKEQPKGDDIPDQLYPTIVLELTQGFKKVNVGPLKDLNLNKASYEKWLARKREKEHEEGLSAGKYSNKDLADSSASKFVTEKFGNVSDHLAYAWNEIKHGNLINASVAMYKAYGTAIAKIGAAAVDLVGKLYPVGLTQGLVAAFTGETSKNEKAWDEIRMKLYGLDKTTTNAKEYERIVSLIKDFEVRQLHVIDGEEQMVEDDLRELAEEIFTEKVRSKIKFRLNSSGIPIIDTSKDLSSESRSFVISWYKRIFLPIFGLYANMVRMSYGDGPGDNIVIDNVPEDQRAELLKEYEREAKKMLDKNIDTEILRLSPEGFYDYLIMRSEEDIAELSKDSEGLVKEDDLSYGDKLSRSLDDAGNDLSKAWSLKFKNPGKALGLAAKGIGKAAWGVVKTTVTSITSSIVDLLVGSANEHRWETRFIDYGFTSREGSSDYFKNDNLRSMEEFENEAGKQLLEDNTGKPDEEYFVKIALNSGFIENCCQKIFNSGSGIDGLSLAATNMSNIFSLWNPGTWGLAATAKVMNRALGIRSLSELKEKLVDYLVSNAKDSADLEKTELSIKTKVADMINYLDFWWTIRFKPVFDAFISVVTAYGVEPDDIDVDDIPQESRDEAFEAYKKASAIALKKDRAAMYTLSAEGCALYLEKVEEYREDAKDGTIDNSGNPLAKFYKEKEQQFEDNVVAAVVANAGGLDKVEKARVAKALSKASVEIDSELSDVNAMAKYAAKDILEQLNVKDLLNKNHTPKESIYGILMKLTMGENHYDKIAKGSGWIFDDSLGKLFTEFVDNAHECLYGTDADKLADYLKEFAESCLQSDLFIFNTPKGGKVKFENIPRLNAWIDAAYPNLGSGDHTANYFGTWFAYRFMPYYAYFVTLVNKANDKQDLKEKPDVDDLTVMRRNYVIDKLVKAENKGLISAKAKTMKIDANSFYKFFEKLNETEGNYRAFRAEVRSNGRKALEEQIKDAERQLAEDRARRKASNKSKEDIKRDVEEKDLANVDVVSTVKPGTRVGDNKAKRKGRSCTDAERQYIYNFLTSELGLTPEQAAAVMGNMMQESSMSPDVINRLGAVGLCQWLGYRVNGGRGYKGLIPFAKENGLDPYSVEAQMKYLKWELENVPYEKNRFDKFVRNIVTDPRNPNKTVAQCAVGFRVGFERCGEDEAQDSKRVGYAKEFYRKFGPGTIPEHLSNTSVLDTAPNDNTGTTGAVTTKQPSQVPDNRNEQADAASRALLPQYRYKDVQYNVGTTSTNTSSPNVTSSVGVSGSEQQPTYFGSYGNMSDQTRKACDYVTKHSHAHSLGKCARYVANALQAAGYKFNRQPSAYMYHTNGILTKMGFTCIGSANARPQAGDICVINRFKGHPHGHICMYNGRQWISDFRQRTASPYLAGAPGGIWYYRPNGSTNATANVVSSVNNEIAKNNEEAYTNAVNNVRSNSPAEPVRHTSASVISNTSTEGNNDNIRTLSAMQTDITNANSGNAPIISELKLISSILAAFKGDVSGFIKMITTNAGLTKTNTANKSTAEIATDKNISDEKLNILIDKLNELAQLISTSGNPSTAKVPQKYHVRDNYMQGYPLQANKVNS